MPDVVKQPSRSRWRWAAIPLVLAAAIAWLFAGRTATERNLTGTWSRVVVPQRTDFLQFSGDGWLTTVSRFPLPDVDGMVETRETSRWFASDDRLQIRFISDRQTLPWRERFAQVLRGRWGPGWTTARVRCEPPDRIWINGFEYARVPKLPAPLIPE